MTRLLSAAAASIAFVCALSMQAAAEPTRDAHAAAAGNYQLDANHTAVVARVPHGGFSYEIFRFTPTSGTLTWNPDSIAANQLTVNVNVGSILTPVEGFARELSGPHFLNTAQFPQATFTSTAFHQTDAGHGAIDGNLTLKGVTKPVTFNVEIVGAGQGMRGGSVLGFHATTNINNADYSLPGFISGQTEIVIDGEFDKH